MIKISGGTRFQYVKNVNRSVFITGFNNCLQIKNEAIEAITTFLERNCFSENVKEVFGEYVFEIKNYELIIQEGCVWKYKLKEQQVIHFLYFLKEVCDENSDNVG
jgi:hypothetical protein